MSNDPFIFATALLAGGKSTRMGQDKAFLEWHGEPLWQAQWNKLSALNPARLMLSCREQQNITPLFADVLVDPPDNAGPLPAILRCLEFTNYPLLVLAVDMPSMTVDFLRGMIQTAAQSQTGLIFQSANRYEPLCAIYPQAVLPLLRSAVGENRLRLQSFAQEAVNAGLMMVQPLPESDQPLFLNLNSPEDFPDAASPPH